MFCVSLGYVISMNMIKTVRFVAAIFILMIVGGTGDNQSKQQQQLQLELPEPEAAFEHFGFKQREKRDEVVDIQESYGVDRNPKSFEDEEGGIEENDGPNEADGINPCRVQPCKNDGVCEENPKAATNFRCVCTLGFYGDRCQFTNEECEKMPCLNSGQCVATPDGYECICEDKYTGQHCDVLLVENEEKSGDSILPSDTSSLDAIIAIAAGAAIFLIALTMFCCCVLAERRKLTKRHQAALELGLRESLPNLNLCAVSIRVLKDGFGKLCSLCKDDTKVNEKVFDYLTIERQENDDFAQEALLSTGELERLQREKEVALQAQQDSLSHVRQGSIADVHNSGRGSRVSIPSPRRGSSKESYAGSGAPRSPSPRRQSVTNSPIGNIGQERRLSETSNQSFAKSAKSSVESQTTVRSSRRDSCPSTRGSLPYVAPPRPVPQKRKR